MRSIFFGAATLMLTAPAVAGPISKWDEKEPKFRYETGMSVFDVERCMIDLDGVPVPIKIWQADRPNEMKLLWTSSFTPNVAGRIDVNQGNAKTSIVGWNIADSAIEKLKACAKPIS